MSWWKECTTCCMDCFGGVCGTCCAMWCDCDPNGNDYSPKSTDPNDRNDRNGDGKNAPKNMLAQAHFDSASLSLLPGIYVSSHAAKAERAPQGVELERA